MIPLIRYSYSGLNIRPTNYANPQQATPKATEAIDTYRHFNEPYFEKPAHAIAQGDIFFRGETDAQKKAREEAESWSEHERQRDAAKAEEKAKLQRTRRSGGRRK